MTKKNWNNIIKKPLAFRSFYKISLAVSSVSFISLISLIYLSPNSYLMIAVSSWFFITSLLIPLIHLIYKKNRLKNIHFRYLIYSALVASTTISGIIETGILEESNLIKLPLIFVFISGLILILFYNFNKITEIVRVN